jgi:hypothetical protein
MPEARAGQAPGTQLAGYTWIVDLLHHSIQCCRTIPATCNLSKAVHHTTSPVQVTQTHAYAGKSRGLRTSAKVDSAYPSGDTV